MRAVVISGLSGSGKSAAIRALEDAGYYCIDNLPVPLLRPFLELSSQSTEQIQKLAVVIDARGRKYLEQLPQTLEGLSAEGHSFELIFLEASDEVLERRFSETRRRHPLSPNGSVIDGIVEERRLLGPLRGIAAEIVDTSLLSPHDLRKDLLLRFSSTRTTPALDVSIMSFGFKHGLPRTADLVLDVRFLQNPYFKADLKTKKGTDPEVIDFVLSQADATQIISEYGNLLSFLVPRFDREGKSYLILAVGCTGGKHRSVVIATELSKAVQALGYSVKVSHRDLDRE